MIENLSKAKFVVQCTPAYRDTFPEIWFPPTQMPPSYWDESRLPYTKFS